MKQLYADLQDTRWVQRDASFRYDNYLSSMKNEDGSQRLVRVFEEPKKKSNVLFMITECSDYQLIASIKTLVTYFFVTSF